MSCTCFRVITTVTYVISFRSKTKNDLTFWYWLTQIALEYWLSNEYRPQKITGRHQEFCLPMLYSSCGYVFENDIRLTINLKLRYHKVQYQDCVIFL